MRIMSFVKDRGVIKAILINLVSFLVKFKSISYALLSHETIILLFPF